MQLSRPDRQRKKRRPWTTEFSRDLIPAAAAPIVVVILANGDSCGRFAAGHVVAHPAARRDYPLTSFRYVTRCG